MANAKDANQTSTHKFFLLGDTGSGKTSQLLTLPGRKFAYLFDPNAILSLRGHDIEYAEFLPDKLNLRINSLTKGKGDGGGAKSNDLYTQFEKDFDEKLDSGFFDGFDVIAIDSATTLLDLIMDRMLSINGRAGQWPQQDDYGPQMLVFTNICRTLMSMNKTVFMTGHLEVKQDELTKRILRRPMMTGRLVQKIPLLFSDIFATEVTNDGQGRLQYNMMTVPDRMTTVIRTSMKGLKPIEDITVDWKKDPVGQGLGKLMMMDKG